MKQGNFLRGKVGVTEDGHIWVEKGVKFGGMVDPKITSREWFYLAHLACLEKGRSCAFFERSIGSRATIWRTKKSLIKKGYL